MGQDPTLDVQSSANVDTPDHLARQPSKTPSDLALEETSMYEYVYDTQPNTDAGTRRPSKTPSDLALEETSMYKYVYDTQPRADADTRRPSKTPSDLALEETSMYKYVYDTQPTADADTQRASRQQPTTPSDLALDETSVYEYVDHDADVNRSTDPMTPNSARGPLFDATTPRHRANGGMEFQDVFEDPPTTNETTQFDTSRRQESSSSVNFTSRQPSSSKDRKRPAENESRRSNLQTAGVAKKYGMKIAAVPRADDWYQQVGNEDREQNPPKRRTTEQPPMRPMKIAADDDWYQHVGNEDWEQNPPKRRTTEQPPVRPIVQSVAKVNNDVLFLQKPRTQKKHGQLNLQGFQSY